MGKRFRGAGVGSGGQPGLDELFFSAAIFSGNGVILPGFLATVQAETAVWA
jgi:hypothetical protein